MVGIQVRMHPTLDILVNSIGQVYHIYRRGHARWTFGHKDSRGYMKVSLGNKQVSVHRLVAETFLSNPESKPQVDHIDRDTTNNCVDNLRWVSAKENCRNRSDVEKVSRRGIPHSFEDKKAYGRAHRKEYVKAHPEIISKWNRNHKYVRLANGYGKFFPIEQAQQLLKLPVKDRLK